MTAPSIPLQHLAAAKRDTALSLLIRREATAARRIGAAIHAHKLAEQAVADHITASYPAEATPSALGVDVE